MTVKREPRVYCDGIWTENGESVPCAYKSAEYEGFSDVEAREVAARIQEWTIDGDQDYCPLHAKAHERPVSDAPDEWQHEMRDLLRQRSTDAGDTSEEEAAYLRRQIGDA
jgi:hypothetical protein